MPLNLFLKNQSSVGYDNSLKRATAEMKLRVNKTVNLEMRSVGVKHVDGGSSKITRSTSQPSNPINKTSTEVQVKKSPPTNDVGETNNDIIKVGLISARLVSAFLIHRLFF